MSQARETSFNPPSPHSSSGGADSYNHEGTPDTRLTAFSPEDNSARSNKLLKTAGLDASSDSRSVHFTAVKSSEGYSTASGGTERDPFVSGNPVAKTEQKLSPTASAFRPVTIPLVAHGSLNGSSGYSIGPLMDPQTPNVIPSTEFSTELNISRYLLFSSPSRSLTTGEVEDYFTKLENQFRSQFNGKLGKRSAIPEGGKIYVRLTNVKYARIAHDCNKLRDTDYSVDYISSSEFYRVMNPGARVEDVPDGQVHVLARLIAGMGLNTAQHQIQALVLDLLLQRGADVFAFRRLSEPSAMDFRGLVEFTDLDDAAALTSLYNGLIIGGVQLALALRESTTTAATGEAFEGYAPSPAPINEMTNIFQGMSVSRTPQQVSPLATSYRHGQSPTPLQAPHNPMAMYPMVYHNQIPTSYVVDQTPTRRHAVTSFTPMSPLSSGMPIMGPVFTPPATPMTIHTGYTSPRSLPTYGRPDSRRQNAMRVNRSPYYNAAGHHNQVDINRIRDGIDVRTTIMLRNIPNKVDQAMLKRIIDESSWGKYDFMYLRIDFANDCNVGYAFINFVDPLDIIAFVNARANQRWNCFKSDKVAEISYATIQGKDCLVQKFRNSSVMLEAPHYRPKLYFTSNGPNPTMAGEEEPFPEPDNQSKMKRSCENAEHVGLFTPNAGQHFRDEQRRRRSQYDRGTRLAALEEYDYDAHIQQQGFMPMNN